MISLFLMKLLDNTVSTLKNIDMIKGRYFRASIHAAISSYLYFSILAKIAKANNQMAFIIVSLAVFLGTYIPAIIMKRKEKDNFWVFEITPKTSKQAKKLADQLRSNNLSVKAEKAYTDKDKKTLTVKVYCETKKESQLTKELARDFKYIVNEVKTYNI